MSCAVCFGYSVGTGDDCFSNTNMKQVKAQFRTRFFRSFIRLGFTGSEYYTRPKSTVYPKGWLSNCTRRQLSVDCLDGGQVSRHAASIQVRLRCFWFRLDENSLLEALPQKMKADLAIHVHYDILSKVQLFQVYEHTGVTISRAVLSKGDGVNSVYSVQCRLL